MPTAAIIIPTRGRADYLDVTLYSVAPQARRAGAELLVVDDGHHGATERVAAAHGARLLHPSGSGANAARNAGIAATLADTVVLVDDDILAPPDWLAAMLDAVAEYPRAEVFGGPIRARLEGGGPRACGREPAPITTLDFGAEDREVPLVWSANMAIRRSALERVGPFDETIKIRGDEEDWERRYVALGGRIRYVSRAGVEHRRSPADARLRPLTRAAYAQGRAARRYDEHKGQAPRLATELRVVAGCVWHVGRRRCAVGIVMAGHATGRLREALPGCHGR